MATTLIVPELGVSGTWTLTGSFSTLLKSSVTYKCTAIRSLKDILAESIDPYTKYYLAVDSTIEETVYETDLANGVYIISVQNSSGDSFYFPNSYLASYPSSAGVSYTAMLISADLGALPDSLDLTALKTALTDICLDTIGVKLASDPILTARSKATIISNDSSIGLEATRLANIAASTTDTAKLNALQIQYDALYTKFTALQTAYIALKGSSTTTTTTS